jgi:hypothetical protein
MNDSEAIDAITEILEAYAAHEIDQFAAINKVAYVIGYNKIAHQEAKATP